MKHYFVLAILLTFTLSDCEETASSRIDLEATDQEIHYIKSGGWINTAKLDIRSNGRVQACHIAHASAEIIDSASTVLTYAEKEKIVGLFRSFSNYARHYDPEHWYTDGEYYLIVRNTDEAADTVSVYEPENCNLPSGLENIIEELEHLWHRLLD